MSDEERARQADDLDEFFRAHREKRQDPMKLLGEFAGYDATLHTEMMNGVTHSEVRAFVRQNTFNQLCLALNEYLSSPIHLAELDQQRFDIINRFVAYYSSDKFKQQERTQPVDIAQAIAVLEMLGVNMDSQRHQLESSLPPDQRTDRMKQFFKLKQTKAN